MIRLFAAAASILAVTVRPASAFWIEWPNGSYTYVDGGVCFWAAVAAVVLVGVFVAAGSSANGSAAAYDADPAGSAEQYDDEAARLRAMSRKLDAETDLAESLIKAKRTRAELDDIEAMFRAGKLRRRR